MKAVVLHVNSATPTSQAPTMRIARFVSKTLGIPLVSSVQSAAEIPNEPLDVVFVKYGILKFSNHRDECMRILGLAKRVIDLQNDYLMVPDKRLREAGPPREVWGTVPKSCEETGGAYINWNAITWKWGVKPPKHTLPGIIYYGAFREGRAQDFRDYFGPDVPYPVVFSANPRNKAKFAALNPKADIVPPLAAISDANVYQGTIYLEDEFTHGVYCSPANRFYECLYSRIPMLFDAACRGTFNHPLSEYDIEPYVVSSYADVERLRRDMRNFGEAQYEAWRRDYRAEVRDHLERLARKRLGWRGGVA